ncbi:transcription factor SRM1-like [Malania oleifera]|uniref:transcription factor SRM1-like n=1 Tax=Malania oleifera TaxID=397392 RepID=UPI0025AE9CF4|nr:transcription factor SRM1-like [Malania oleifera]
MFQGNQYYWVAAGESSAPEKQSIWTLEENQAFEEAILLIPAGTPYRWDWIASLIPGKSSLAVKEHYDVIFRNWRDMDGPERVESSSYMNQSPPVLGPVPAPTQISVETRPGHGEDQCKKRTLQTIEEHRLFFEEALLPFSPGTPCRWETIACHLPWNSPMVHCWSDTEAGRVDPPSQANELSLVLESGPPLSPPPPTQTPLGARPERGDDQPKKRILWTEEEHRLFLYGLEKFGKGKWKQIANEVVLTKTPSQVASHAQKFFLRHSPANQLKGTKRSSIHDITIAFPSNDP